MTRRALAFIESLNAELAALTFDTAGRGRGRGRCRDLGVLVFFLRMFLLLGIDSIRPALGRGIMHFHHQFGRVRD